MPDGPRRKPATEEHGKQQPERGVLEGVCLEDQVRLAETQQKGGPGEENSPRPIGGGIERTVSPGREAADPRPTGRRTGRRSRSSSR